MSRFDFQRDCIRRALDELPGQALNVGCCRDGLDNPNDGVKHVDPERIINCDVSAIDEIYGDPEDETRITGTRPTAAEVLFDAAADEWPFKDDTAAIVVLGDILEHMSPDDIVSTLKEARRVSQRVCVTVPEDTRPTNTPERADRYRRGHVHRTIVTESLLRKCLRDAGWKIHKLHLVPDYDQSSVYWGQQVMGYWVEARRPE